MYVDEWHWNGGIGREFLLRLQKIHILQQLLLLYSSTLTHRRVIEGNILAVLCVSIDAVFKKVRTTDGNELSRRKVAT